MGGGGGAAQGSRKGEGLLWGSRVQGGAWRRWDKFRWCRGGPELALHWCCATTGTHPAPTLAGSPSQPWQPAPAPAPHPAHLHPLQAQKLPKLLWGEGRLHRAAPPHQVHLLHRAAPAGRAGRRTGGSRGWAGRRARRRVPNAAACSSPGGGGAAYRRQQGAGGKRAPPGGRRGRALRAASLLPPLTASHPTSADPQRGCKCRWRPCHLPALAGCGHSRLHGGARAVVGGTSAQPAGPQTAWRDHSAAQQPACATRQRHAQRIALGAPVLRACPPLAHCASGFACARAHSGRRRQLAHASPSSPLSAPATFPSPAMATLLVRDRSTGRSRYSGCPLYHHTNSRAEKTPGRSCAGRGESGGRGCEGECWG